MARPRSGDSSQRPNTSDAQLNPKVQLIISIIIGAILGLLYGLWRDQIIFWLIIGTAVGLMSGLFSWRRIALTRRYEEREGNNRGPNNRA